MPASNRLSISNTGTPVKRCKNKQKKTLKSLHN